MLPDTLQGTCRMEDTTSWKYGKTHRSTPPGGCQQPQRSPAKHSEAVKPDSGAISGILATGKQILVMWWWFLVRTDLHLQNFRIQVPSTISAFPSADAHESGNMLEHHLPFYKSSNPFPKKTSQGSMAHIFRFFGIHFSIHFRHIWRMLRTFIACLVGGFFRRWALCIQGEKMGLLGPASGKRRSMQQASNANLKHCSFMFIFTPKQKPGTGEIAQ